MILDVCVFLISKNGNMLSTLNWFMVLEFLVFLINVISVILSRLCTLYYQQYNGTATVLSERKLKGHREASETVYVDSSTSTGI